MTIWKFPLQTTDEQIIKIPLVNWPLSVQVQNGTPCIWSVVDPESEVIKVRVRIFGTGREGVTNDMDYIGTYQLHGGGLVLHVFLAGVVAN